MNLSKALLVGALIPLQIVAMEQTDQKKQKRVSWPKELAQIRFFERYLPTPAEEFNSSTTDEQFSTVFTLVPGVMLNKKKEKELFLKLFGFDFTHRIGNLRATGKKITFTITKDGKTVKTISLKRPIDHAPTSSDGKKRKKDENIEN
ncbi:MAG TPA: hypothetical protein VHO47_03235 [Candidatus Babeliales bacterium]|nr:hypothetical protein [Candidatus Babeliales bacterium]